MSTIIGIGLVLTLCVIGFKAVLSLVAKNDVDKAVKRGAQIERIRREWIWGTDRAGRAIKLSRIKRRKRYFLCQEMLKVWRESGKSKIITMKRK